jgi:hypothetical protein
MNTEQLLCIIDQDCMMRRYVAGVYASDELPEIGHYPFGGILNTAPSSKSGQHWIAFFFTHDRKGLYFNSSGNAPTTQFQDFMEKYSEEVIYNSEQLQADTTNTCGLYCLYFLFLACRGKLMHEILSNFEKNILFNEQMVYNFSMQNLSFCHCTSIL